MSGSLYTNGLSVSDVIALTITLTPAGAQPRNFGATMIIGGSGVISVTQRLRSYNSIEALGLDFASNTPEFLAGEDFFDANPQPSFVYVGAWAKTATPGIIQGGVLAPSQQLLSNFTSIANGSLSALIGGAAMALTGLNFTTAANLNAVAGVVQAAITAASLTHTFVWNASQNYFELTSSETGTAGTVAYPSVPGAGTNVADLLGLTLATNAILVQGALAESPLAAVQALANLTNDFYMFGFADTSITDQQHEAIAAYIQAASISRVYGITTQAAAAIDPTQTSDLGSFLKEQGYGRTVGQYSSTSPYAIFAFFGRNASINYSTGSNVAITMKFQTEPGVAAETLTETAAATLISKNWNVFVNYQNGVPIVQNGVMFNGDFFDVRQGCDALQNQAQTDLFNAFVQAGSKIPQTDSGMNVLTTTLANTLTQWVANGVLAPGIWNAPGFGVLQQGQMLTKGFYIYAPSINSQSEAVRQTRAAPMMQVACKLAGAIHSASVAISVNQ